MGKQKTTNMVAKIVKRTVSDRYFELVKQLPLVHIASDDHLRAAQEFIDRLQEQKLDHGAQAYLDVLTDLVKAHENEQEPVADVSEAVVLRELMRANELTQARLAKEVGISQSTISAVLGGTRSLTKDQVLALAKFFRVLPGAFLPS